MSLALYAIIQFASFLLNIAIIAIVFGIILRTKKGKTLITSDEEETSHASRDIHWLLYIVLTPVACLFDYVLGSLMSWSWMHGLPVLQLVLGQTIGFLIFAPLAEYLLKKVRISVFLQTIFPVVIAMGSSGRAFAAIIMSAFGLPVAHGGFPFIRHW